MFQRLTSLFFSDPPPPEDLDCPRAFVSEEDDVDGWLIIDLPGEWGLGPGPGRPTPGGPVKARWPSSGGKGAAKAIGGVFPQVHWANWG